MPNETTPSGRSRAADIAKLEADRDRFIVMRNRAQQYNFTTQAQQAEALLASVESELAVLRAGEALTTANRSLLDRCR